MKRALISDIHANLEALTAVMQDIRDQGVDEVFCLGDIVGYGPNPCECLDTIINSCKKTILGNHDQAALFDPDGFNPVALQAVYWTREQLEVGGGSPATVNRRWDFLGELPKKYSEGEMLYVHGSPREPTNEYVFPEDVYNQRKMESIFGRMERYCFAGHTHIPGVFTFDREFLTPEDVDYQYRLSSEPVMVNVGSVGQPRDNDPRSCYVIVDDDVLTFRRVEYDVETTVNKIFNVPDLDNMLGERLRSGR